MALLALDPLRHQPKGLLDVLFKKGMLFRTLSDEVLLIWGKPSRHDRGENALVMTAQVSVRQHGVDRILPNKDPAQYVDVQMRRKDDPLFDRFIRVATTRWMAIVPGGDAHIEAVGSTEPDQRNVLGYALKWLDPGSSLEFVDSRMFR